MMHNHFVCRRFSESMREHRLIYVEPAETSESLTPEMKVQRDKLDDLMTKVVKGGIMMKELQDEIRAGLKSDKFLDRKEILDFSNTCRKAVSKLPPSDSVPLPEWEEEIVKAFPPDNYTFLNWIAKHKILNTADLVLAHTAGASSVPGDPNSSVILGPTSMGSRVDYMIGAEKMSPDEIIARLQMLTLQKDTLEGEMKAARETMNQARKRNRNSPEAQRAHGVVMGLYEELKPIYREYIFLSKLLKQKSGQTYHDWRKENVPDYAEKYAAQQNRNQARAVAMDKDYAKANPWSGQSIGVNRATGNPVTEWDVKNKNLMGKLHNSDAHHQMRIEDTAAGLGVSASEMYGRKDMGKQGTIDSVRDPNKPYTFVNARYTVVPPDPDMPEPTYERNKVVKASMKKIREDSDAVGVEFKTRIAKDMPANLKPDEVTWSAGGEVKEGDGKTVFGDIVQFTDKKGETWGAVMKYDDKGIRHMKSDFMPYKKFKNVINSVPHQGRSLSEELEAFGFNDAEVKNWQELKNISPEKPAVLLQPKYLALGEKYKFAKEALAILDNDVIDDIRKGEAILTLVKDSRFCSPKAKDQVLSRLLDTRSYSTAGVSDFVRNPEGAPLMLKVVL